MSESPVYLVFSGEVHLEAPVEHAWPHVLEYTSWQNYPLAEHVSGPRGGEGEVVRLQKDEAGHGTPPYFTRTILLEPGHRVVWKVYPDAEGFMGAAGFQAFVDFRVEEADGGTRFSYNSIYEYLVASDDEAEVEAFREEARASSLAVFAVIFPKLKQLVESTFAAAAA
jgi:hypothetical protein